MEKRSVPRIILSKIFGFLIFLIFLALVVYLKKYITFHIYVDIVNFLNDNVVLVLIMAFIGIFSDIFWSFSYPINAIAPIISSFLSIFIVTFVYRFWLVINSYLNVNLPFSIQSIYIVAFLLTLIFGYIVVLSRSFRIVVEGTDKNKLESRLKEINVESGNVKEKQDKIIRKNEKVDWDDIGEQFKIALYNLGKSLSKVFEPKPKSKTYKRR